MIALLLAWLVAGATLNVAVAWGCASYCSFDFRTANPDKETAADNIETKRCQKWYESRFPFPVTPFVERATAAVDPDLEDSQASIRFQPLRSQRAYETRGLEVRRIKTFSLTDPVYAHVEVLRLQSGWPTLCMEAAGWHGSKWDRLAQADDFVLSGVGSLPFPVEAAANRNVSFGSEGHWLPLRPIWPEFAINTLFYAGVLWILFCGPFALRRMIRRRRGLCPHCAYPTWGGGQSPVCTECGAAVDI